LFQAYRHKVIIRRLRLGFNPFAAARSRNLRFAICDLRFGGGGICDLRFAIYDLGTPPERVQA
jgi:hypothetical protein